jgi:hypothetical protein
MTDERNTFVVSDSGSLALKMGNDANSAIFEAEQAQAVDE